MNDNDYKDCPQCGYLTHKDNYIGSVCNACKWVNDGKYRRCHCGNVYDHKKGFTECWSCHFGMTTKEDRKAFAGGRYVK